MKGKASSSSWTWKENKLFETALANIEEDRPDRWEAIARYVGNKSVDEVLLHYQTLLEDIAKIESDELVLIPNYVVYNFH